MICPDEFGVLRLCVAGLWDAGTGPKAPNIVLSLGRLSCSPSDAGPISVFALMAVSCVSHR